MKAKALFYIRLRDGPRIEHSECYEFRHLFVDQPSDQFLVKKWRLSHRAVVLVTLFIVLAALSESALRLFG